ncbi:30S ribosomal protein S1 [Kocuria sp. JC486]|uniref:30S ribosomal protein S1 n=1 Tax=Kocuria sp. JC486 TaxID=1970736 RepID=UPI001FD79C7F|nr:30S ribosomal protein S1 [Kocuria sp. JC486]
MTTTTPQVAVNDIGTEEDFLAAVDATIKYFNDGDLVEGTVVKVDRDEVLLDIGYKTEGVIPSRELSIKHDIDPDEVVAVGDEVEALVLTKEDKEGRLILSKKRAQYERAWGDIEKVKEEDGVVTGTVIEVVKGGLIIDIGLRGFLPASLVEMRRVRDLAPYIGQKLEAKIIELDKNRNNVVLSRRAWLEQTQSEVRSDFLNKLEKGQVRSGHVSSIVNFGAFVDLGGVDGLVHVSELSWKHIDHPGEVVEVGQEVKVEVLDVDMDRERVSLSLKATQEDPWQLFARTHALGQVVPGKVTKLVPFGAFVRVEDGIEGLVHISELAQRHVDLADQVVDVNEDLFVKVIDIDLDRRRISLSLKQANEGVDPESTEFDPAQYGMAAEYDDEGNYKYPEGFDPETNEWIEGFEDQRAAWEQQYADAQTRWEAHKEQVRRHLNEDAEAAVAGAGVAPSAAPTSYSSEAPAEDEGTLASDEALAALRERPPPNSPRKEAPQNPPAPGGGWGFPLSGSGRRRVRGSIAAEAPRGDRTAHSAQADGRSTHRVPTRVGAARPAVSLAT